MKDKLMILALAAALLVGLVPVRSAYANVEQSVDNSTVYNGIEFTFDAETYEIKRSDSDVVMKPTNAMCEKMALGYNWAIITYEWRWQVYAVPNDCNILVYNDGEVVRVGLCDKYGNIVTTDKEVYYEFLFVDETRVNKSCAEQQMQSSSGMYYYGDSLARCIQVFSNHEVKGAKKYYTNESGSTYNWLVAPYSVENSPNYTLLDFCADYGVNAWPSENESEYVTPFAYDTRYIYLVTDSNVGKYPLMLTQINYDRRQVYHMYLHDVDAVACIGLGSVAYNYDAAEISRYGYDEDGQGWKLIDVNNYTKIAYGAPVENIEALEGGEVVYTNYDIYDSASMNSVAVARATEYVKESEITPVPTPTTAPSGGSGTSGSVSGGTLYLYNPVLDGVISTPNASVHDVPNGADEDILVDLLQGMKLKVRGWIVDSGVMWYYVTYTNVYEDTTTDFTGYVKADSVAISVVGDTEEEQDMTLKEQLQIISSFVVSVPLIIGALFSFMPPWCLTMVGIAFSITAIIMIKRGALG